jgi:hypothetical protein
LLQPGDELRTAMTPAAFQAAWNAGQALDIEAVIAEYSQT